MKLLAKAAIALGAALVFMNCVTSLGHAAGPSRPVVLVATPRLAGSLYEETVLVVTPLSPGQHIGFIVNRPTRVRLEAAFPGHAPSRKVVAPLSLGGPMHASMVVALTRKAPAGPSATIPLLPGLVAVMDGPSVDRIIETTPNEARYFAGLVIWGPGELEEEIRGGAWHVWPAGADIVFRADPAQLWKELSAGGRWVEASRACRSGSTCFEQGYAALAAISTDTDNGTASAAHC